MMDPLTFAWIAVIALGFASVVSSLISSGKASSGHQFVLDNRRKAMSFVRDTIRHSMNDTVWSIAGELDPRFYSEILSQLLDGLRNHKMQLEFVFGPGIVIEDKQYDLYVENGKYKSGYWKAHPMLMLAYEFAKNGRVRLYVKREERGREETHCFCGKNEASPTITEKPHKELLPSPVLIETGTRVGYWSLRARFEELIRSGDAELWNPLAPGAEEKIRFIRYSNMLKESTAEIKVN